MSYWPEYVPVAERKKKAAKKIESLKKKGQAINPVVINGRMIARSFWGKSWCSNLESYSDYENRLPRGRSYVRNNSVVDLHIKKGCVSAMVSGSSLYSVDISIQALDGTCWKTIIKECAGKIDSLIELLQGKFSKAIMEIITNKDYGLFPKPHEIKLDCSCPDYASMCKHVAATLYGVGARLDDEPEKLFLLRQVDHLDLISAAHASDKFGIATSNDDAVLDDSDLASLFGIELDTKDARVNVKTKPTVKEKIVAQKKVINKRAKKAPVKKVAEKSVKKVPAKKTSAHGEEPARASRTTKMQAPNKKKAGVKKKAVVKKKKQDKGL